MGKRIGVKVWETGSRESEPLINTVVETVVLINKSFSPLPHVVAKQPKGIIDSKDKFWLENDTLIINTDLVPLVNLWPVESEVR